MTDTHTDPDGKKWTRVHVNDPYPSRVTRFAEPGDRWVLERPEPETEEWVRLSEVRKHVRVHLVCGDKDCLADGTDFSEIRRLPKEAKP